MESLPMLMEERRSTVVLWCAQGDAAAGVEAEATVDGGGGASELERRVEDDDAKRHEEEK
jgi:hypothetical protein